MKLVWSESSWADYLHWQEHDHKMVERINALIKDIKRTPFKGLGKPEPLKENLSEWWSRRIGSEHRVVYRVVGTGEAQTLEVASCRYHY